MQTNIYWEILNIMLSRHKYFTVSFVIIAIAATIFSNSLHHPQKNGINNINFTEQSKKNLGHIALIKKQGEIDAGSNYMGRNEL